MIWNLFWRRLQSRQGNQAETARWTYNAQNYKDYTLPVRFYNFRCAGAISSCILLAVLVVDLDYLSSFSKSSRFVSISVPSRYCPASSSQTSSSFSVSQQPQALCSPASLRPPATFRPCRQQQWRQRAAPATPHNLTVRLGDARGRGYAHLPEGASRRARRSGWRSGTGSRG